MNSLKRLRKKWTISYSPIFNLILGLEKLYLGSKSDFLLIHGRRTGQFTAYSKPNKWNCDPHPYPTEKLPKIETTEGLHLISNDIYHHSTSTNHSQDNNNLTLWTSNDPFQKILNSPPHTLTTIYFPSIVCTPFLYSYYSFLPQLLLSNQFLATLTPLSNQQIPLFGLLSPIPSSLATLSSVPWVCKQTKPQPWISPTVCS